ncbi:MAG: hypothetical protein HYS12_28240 [Planctomycetes bacterium]|nr:hypothetical protein [Planctomycetota bacterium]
MDEPIEQRTSKRRNRIAEIVAITDRFCDRHLDEEFKQLCREMAVVLCREGCPVGRGKAAGWAAGIIYSVAWVNFLGDPSQPYHMKAEDMARAVGVSPATLMAKARVVRDSLHLHRMDPRWSTKEMLEHNPLVWLVEVDGLPYDIRRAPRHVQEEAVRRGLIPFVPEEEEDAWSDESGMRRPTTTE